MKLIKTWTATLYFSASFPQTRCEERKIKITIPWLTGETAERKRFHLLLQLRTQNPNNDTAMSTVHTMFKQLNWPSSREKKSCQSLYTRTRKPVCTVLNLEPVIVLLLQYYSYSTQLILNENILIHVWLFIRMSINNQLILLDFKSPFNVTLHQA